jgi:magnesium transporter
MGTLTGMFAWFTSGVFIIGIVVGVSLFLAMTLATTLACLTPIILRGIGKDPAVGSGPFTTALQDVVSLTIYFLVASALL